MEPATATSVRDVAEADFDLLVVERSHTVPVVVDFWAEWCAPCRALGPVLEIAVTARAGKVELAKIDVDANRGLQARFGVQGIPAVKAFRDGAVASEFTGAKPAAEVEQFVAALMPSEAEELAAAGAASGDDAALRRALELDPRQAGAAVALARLLLGQGSAAEALEVARKAADTDFAAGGLAARAQLELDGEPAPAAAFSAWEAGDRERALDLLQDEVEATPAGSERRDGLRRVIIGLLNELDVADPLAREHRRRLAAALS